MNKEQRVDFAGGYLEYLSRQQPEYFVTLTFRTPQPDRGAEIAMKGFVLKLLNRLPRKARKSIGGLVCAERHTDTRFDGTYHFHFLFWGLDGRMDEPFAWMREQVVKAASELHPRRPGPRCDCRESEERNRQRTCKGGLSCRGQHLSGAKWVDVQQIQHSSDAVNSYVTADLLRTDRPTGDQLLLIGPTGVLGNLP